jgi:hypothetical protein
MPPINAAEATASIRRARWQRFHWSRGISSFVAPLRQIERAAETDPSR